MNIHEYQAKAILAKYGVAVPKGKVADIPLEAEVIAMEFGTPVVIKAQIHAGGRGKGGGIKLAKTPEEARAFAKQIIGMTLVTHQTGPQGKKVKRVLVEQAGSIKRELYLGMVIDRAMSRVVMMASTEGGVEIENVAARTPEKILKEYIDPALGPLRGRRCPRSRREDELRRQRALPPQGHPGVPGLRRGSPHGDRGVQVRPLLHQTQG